MCSDIRDTITVSDISPSLFSVCLSLSLSFFLLFLISVFPSRPEAKVPPMALGWPLLSLLPCPFANPMNASHRRPPMLRRRSDATKHASHLHESLVALSLLQVPRMPCSVVYSSLGPGPGYDRRGSIGGETREKKKVSSTIPAKK